MSGRYSIMGVSQHLAAPTYPKINEYNRMEARERSGERGLWDKNQLGCGEKKSDVLAKSSRRTLELYYSTQVTGD